MNTNHSKESTELQILLMKEKSKNDRLNEQIKRLQMDLYKEKELTKKLSIKLEEAYKIIKDLVNQLPNNLNKSKYNKIIELQNMIEMKNQEDDELDPGNTKGVQLISGDNIISVGFISDNKEIDNYIKEYKETEIVSRIEEELYNEYPEFKDKDTYLILNENKIKRFKTLKENNIKDGDIMQVHICEDNI